jgi:hypothetical protein
MQHSRDLREGEVHKDPIFPVGRIPDFGVLREDDGFVLRRHLENRNAICKNEKIGHLRISRADGLAPTILSTPVKAKASATGWVAFARDRPFESATIALRCETCCQDLKRNPLNLNRSDISSFLLKSRGFRANHDFRRRRVGFGRVV